MQLYAGHCIEPVIMNHAYMCEHETELNKKGEEDYMLVIDAIMWKYNYWTHMLTSLQQTIVYVHFIYLFSYVTLRFKLKKVDFCSHLTSATAQTPWMTTVAFDWNYFPTF